MATLMSLQRVNLCLSAHDLANLIGIDTLDVCDIEQGTRQIALDLQLKIASVLNADPKLLFDEDGFANFEA